MTLSRMFVSFLLAAFTAFAVAALDLGLHGIDRGQRGHRERGERGQ